MLMFCEYVLIQIHRKYVILFSSSNKCIKFGDPDVCGYDDSAFYRDSLMLVNWCLLAICRPSGCTLASASSSSSSSSASVTTLG